MDFQELYKADACRYGKEWRAYERCFHYYFRKSQTYSKTPMKYWYRFMFNHLKNKRGIELSRNVQVGKGLFLCHSYNMTINSGTVIGNNCNLHKGVTIGQENRGPRKGAPTIGNEVWIGVNAAIVGNISIGNDVLIAPNSYVNCDVPDHSVVFGNPCIIKHRQNATDGYINHIAPEA